MHVFKWTVLLFAIIVGGGIAGGGVGFSQSLPVLKVKTTKGTPALEPVPGVSLADQFQRSNQSPFGV
jgi:hypothetical protein